MTIGRFKDSNKKDFATYDTVAELEAAPASRFSDGAEILWRGYYAAGDFGEAVSLIVESAAAGVNSFTLTDGRFANLYVTNAHIKYFGVVGDGVTDDTVALQAAADSGAYTLVADSSMTVLCGRVNFDNANTKEYLFGNCTFLANATLLDAELSVHLYFSGLSNAIVDGIVIDGNGASITTPYPASSSYALFATSYFHNCSNITITNSYFKDHKGCQLQFTGNLQNIKIVNNKFRSDDALVTRYGLFITPNTAQSDGWLIEGNDFYNNTGINIRGYSPNPADRTLDQPTTGVRIINNDLVKRAMINNAGIGAIITNNRINPQHEQQYFDGVFNDVIFCVTMSAGYGATITNNRLRGFRKYAIEVTVANASTFFVSPSDYEGCLVDDNDIVNDDPDVATYPNNIGISYSNYNGRINSGVISNNTLKKCRINLAGNPSGDLTVDDDFCKNVIVHSNTVTRDAADITSGIVGLFCKNVQFLNNTVDNTGNTNRFAYSITSSKDIVIDGGYYINVRNILAVPTTDGTGLTVNQIGGPITVKNTISSGSFFSVLFQPTSGVDNVNRVYAFNNINKYNGFPHGAVRKISTSDWDATVTSTGVVSQGPTTLKIETGVTSGATAMAKLLRNGPSRTINSNIAATTGFETGQSVLYSFRLHTLAETSSGKNTVFRAIFGKPFASGVEPVTSAISGSLVVGRSYYISFYNAGDDFTNVGASSNAVGVRFVATGTTPTTWTNSSRLNSGMTTADANLFGFEIVGREVYGFFHNGTETTYTALIDTLNTTNDMARQLSIVTGGGTSGGIYFTMNGVYPDEYVQFIPKLGALVSSSYGISFENVSVFGANNAFNISDIQIIDMTN